MVGDWHVTLVQVGNCCGGMISMPVVVVNAAMGSFTNVPIWLGSILTNQLKFITMVIPQS